MEMAAADTAEAMQLGAKASADGMMHVLVVDDDRRLRTLLSRFLIDNSYRVTTAPNVVIAELMLGFFVFDAIILDVMMPGESGLDFAKRWRQVSPIPILMLTARSEGVDRITGLEIGVDDYLGKPFEPRELLLRLGNILKRRIALHGSTSMRAIPEAIRFGDFIFRFDRGELRQKDEIIRITEREREILTILGEASGKQVAREELAGNGAFTSGDNASGIVSDRNVDVQINRLRRKIERDPANPVFLQTVRGVGYRLLIDG